MTSSNVQKFMFSMIALALLMGALAVSSSSTAAQETTNPVGVTGGNTILKPTKQMIRKLKRAKVRVKPTGSAKGGMRKLVFPVTGGRIGMSDGKPFGVIRHRASGLRMGKSTPKLFGFKNPVVDPRGRMIWIGDVGNEVVGAAHPDLATRPLTSPVLDDRSIALFRLSGIFDTNPEDGASRHRFRAQARLTAQSARLFRSKLGLNVKKGNTFGIIGVLVSFAGGDGQGGGIYNLSLIHI